MKRLLCLLLALFTLLTLASCASSTITEETDPPAAKTEKSSSIDEPDETVDPDSVPDIPATFNFGGEEIVILSSDRSWWKDEVSVEQENGEVINDAVWGRNLEIEENLKVKLTNSFVSYGGDDNHIISRVDKSIAGGTREFDIVMANCYKTCMATTKGYFLDLNEIENINLKKSYWMQGYNQAVEFKGAQYSATGAIALSTMRFAFATFFNKEMFDAATVPYLYDAVREGKWTLEYQLSLLETFYRDEDGDLAKSADDIYGLITSDHISTDPYWACCDLPLMTRTSNGEYQFEPNLDRLSTAIDKIILIYKNQGTNVIPKESADAEQDKIRSAFANEKGAMATMRLMETENESIRDMNSHYGVVPMPKLDEDQQNYYTHVHDQFTVATVLSYLEPARRPMVGAVLETMAYLSSTTVVPAYYEITLKFKYASDPDSYEMLDTVMNGRRVDAGNVYYETVGSPHNMMREILKSLTNSIAQKMATQKRTTPKAVKNLNDALNKMKD